MAAAPRSGADHKPASPPGETLGRRYFRPANDDYGPLAGRIARQWPVLAAGVIIGCCVLLALAG